MPTHAAPLCPRCAYDLRGAVDSWKTECPMEGKCPECGLAFHWRDIFYLDPPEWSFEHATSRRPRRFIQTYIRAWFPRRFFAVLRPHHSVVMSRLVIIAVVSLLLVHIGIAASVTSHASIPYFSFGFMMGGGGSTHYPDTSEIVWAALWPYLEMFILSLHPPQLAHLSLWAMVFVALLPLSVFPISVTSDTAALTGKLLFRLAAYSLALAAAILFTLLMFEATIVQWKEDRSSDLIPTLPLAALLVVPAAAHYWWVAAKRYRLHPSPLWLSLAATLVSATATFGAMWFVYANR